MLRCFHNAIFSSILLYANTRWVSWRVKSCISGWVYILLWTYEFSECSNAKMNKKKQNTMKVSSIGISIAAVVTLTGLFGKISI